MNETDYNITLFEACEILNKSKKTLSRYIRRGRITPLKVKSQQGTLEYRFKKDDLDAFRAELARVDREDTQDRADRTDGTEETRKTGQDTTPFSNAQPHNIDTLTEETPTRGDKTGHGRQDRGDRPDRTEETGQDTEVIALLRETTELLKGQLTVKDKQIETISEQMHQLIERDRETNILLKGLQDRIMLLEPPKHTDIRAGEVKDITGQTGRDRAKYIRLAWLSFILLVELGLFFCVYVLPGLLPILKGLYEQYKM